jgi:uncharacterized protein YukE
VQGPADPYTAGFRNNLGAAYFAAGRYNDAVAQLESAVAECERIFGTSHEQTEDLRRNLREARAAAERA